LLDDSNSGGIHVVASYLLRRGGAKISVPLSVEFRKPFRTLMNQMSLISLFGSKVKRLQWVEMRLPWSQIRNFCQQFSDVKIYYIFYWYVFYRWLWYETSAATLGAVLLAFPPL